jgi:hypothetical protein
LCLAGPLAFRTTSTLCSFRWPESQDCTRRVKPYSGDNSGQAVGAYSSRPISAPNVTLRDQLASQNLNSISRGPLHSRGQVNGHAAWVSPARRFAGRSSVVAPKARNASVRKSKGFQRASDRRFAVCRAGQAALFLRHTAGRGRQPSRLVARNCLMDMDLRPHLAAGRTGKGGPRRVRRRNFLGKIGPGLR